MQRIRRIVLWALGGLLLTCLLIVGGLLGFVYLAGPQTWTAAVQTATDQVSTPDMQITPGRFQRRDDGVLHLQALTLSDSEGEWLRLQDLELNLNLSSLFGGLLDIQAVTIGRVDVLRPPLPAADAPQLPDEPFVIPERLEMPELPVALRLGALRIDEVLLAKGVAPEKLRMRVDGAASILSGAQTARLDLVPLDLDQSHLRARLDADLAANELNVDISGDLPLVAPFSQTLGADAGSRVTVRVQGGGPLSRAELDFDVSIGGVADLLGDIVLFVQGADGAGAQISAFGNLTGGVAAQPAAILGSTVQLEVGLHLPDPDTLKVRDLRIGSQYLNLSAAGDVGLADVTLDLAGEGAFLPS